MLRALLTAAVFTLCASPALAQPTTSPAPSTPTSDPSRTAADIEAGATWLGHSNTKFSLGMDCARISSIEKGLQAEANAFQRLGSGFSKFGDVLALTTATAQVAQGKYDDAAKTVGNAAFDKALCAVYGPVACATWASWNAGTAVGGLIRDLPLSGGRTIGDMVDDQWVSWLGPYLHQPLNVKSMEAAFAEFQRRQADLKRRQREAAEFGGQCKAEETKSAVQELLAKAKADAASTPMTPADSGLAAQTEAAISDGQARAKSAIDAGNAKLTSTVQDMQLRALQSSGATSTQSGAPGAAYPASTGQGSSAPGSTCNLGSNTDPLCRSGQSKTRTDPPPQQPSCSNSALPAGQVCTGN